MIKISHTAQKGFTLIELMIVIAIVGILAAVAVPQYANYTSRARAGGAIAELESLKTAVSLCASDLGTVTGCNNGTNGIPAKAAFTVTKNITSQPTISNGVITATTGATDGTNTKLELTLTPTLPAGQMNMVWALSNTICNDLRGIRIGEYGCAAVAAGEDAGDGT